MAKNVLQKSDEELLEEKTGFLLYKNYFDDYCDGFSYEEMGKLFYCICYYEKFRTEPDYPDRATELLFKKIKNNLDINDKEWILETRIRAAKGAKHKGNQYTRLKEKEALTKKMVEEALEQNGTQFQSVPKNGTNGSDTVTETDTDTETDINLYSSSQFNPKQPNSTQDNLEDEYGDYEALDKIWSGLGIA